MSPVATSQTPGRCAGGLTRCVLEVERVVQFGCRYDRRFTGRDDAGPDESAHSNASGSVVNVGRIKSDIRVSPDLSYNSFPFPSPTPTQRTRVDAAAKEVLAARQAHPQSSLADFCGPGMPSDVRAAHKSLDAAVESLFGRRAYKTEAVSLFDLFDLFDLYGVFTGTTPV